MLDNVEIIDANPTIEVIRIVNPFNPRERVNEKLDWAPNKTVAEYFPVYQADLVVSINGKIIPAEEHALTRLAPGDNLVICPVPAGGGGGGKGIFRLVAMIAVSMVAPQLATSLYTSMGGTFVAANAMTVIGAMTVGITVAGAMLVNALLPPPKPASAGGAATQEMSSSYGIDGAKNTSVEGAIVPVIYGTFRTGGNMINAYVENTGDTQMLYVRFVLSEGEVASISGFQINDQPLDQFNGGTSGIVIDTRRGTSDQAVMDWFADTIRPNSLNSELATAWTTYTTDDIDQFRVDIACPQGLFAVDTGSGATVSRSVTLEIEYSVHDAGSWVSLNDSNTHLGTRKATAVATRTVSTVTSGGYTTRKLSDIDLSGLSWTWAEAPNSAWAGAMYQSQANGAAITDYGAISELKNSADLVITPITVDAEGAGTYQITSYVNINKSAIVVKDAKQSAVRRSFKSPRLARSKYDIRIRRTTAKSTATTVSEAVFVSDVNEILLEDLALPYTAMMGAKLKLGDQISGLPKVTALVEGIMVYENHPSNTTGEYAWYYRQSGNPAWIVWDILTNTRYGAGMNPNRLDLAAWREFSQHCIDNNLTWNGPIDAQSNVWDACQMVLRVGHAQLVGVGTRYTVVIEKASTPVMMFSVANMVEGSFKETWLPITDRANEIEVTYFDKLDNYKQRTVKVYDPAALAAGRPARSSSITLYGVVDYETAFKEGYLQLNLNRYILQTVEFSAPLESIGCTVGDLIYVQHDMPQWGFAGRTAAGSTSSVIQLDRTVTMLPGKQYKLLLMVDAIQRASGTVGYITGNSVFLSGYDGSNVKRFKFGEIDRQVVSTFYTGSSYGIVLDDVSGITSGGEYSLWDTDVLEERDIVNTSTTTAVVIAQSTFTQAPGQFVNWMFGEVTKMKKPFRVRAISGSGDYHRDITAIEYNATVYDGPNAIPTQNYSSLDAGVGPVAFTSITEDLFQSGTGYRVTTTVHFAPTQDSFWRASVYARVNSEQNFTLLTSDSTGQASIDLDEGDVVEFKVVPRDSLGAVASEKNTLYTLPYTVLGKLAPPHDVTGLTVSIVPGNLLLKWNANDEIDVAGYEVRLGSSWDSSTLIVTDYAGTSFLVPSHEIGLYTFLVRAIDTGGRKSNIPAAASIVLSRPQSVTGFDCTQNLDRIEFRWDANPESYIAGYELREGETWATARLLTKVTATTYSMTSAAGSGIRTFWIKSIIEPGIECETATFASTNVAAPTNRNAVFTDDEKAAGFSGSRYQMGLNAFGELQLDDGKVYGEYVWEVSLPTSYRARTTIQSAYSAVVHDNTTWADATWNWDSVQANRAWQVTGDVGSVSLQYYIAVEAPLEASYLDAFSLNGTYVGVNGTSASEVTGVTYAPGRFFTGAKMDNFTRLSWTMAIPATFNVSLWCKIDTLEGNQVFWSGKTSGDLRLTAGYDNSIGAFYLEDLLGNTMTLPFALSTGDRVLIGVVQTPTTRRLHVGVLGYDTPLSVSMDIAGLGALSSMGLQW